MSIKSNYSVHDVRLEGIFNRNSLYLVPRYQRGYSWKSENVKNLLDDLSEAMQSFPNQVYLVGQIIVSPHESSDADLKAWEIIDGQQRLTTLYLFMLRVFQHLETSHSFTPTKKQKQLLDDVKSSLQWFGDDQFEDEPKPRLQAASDGGEFIALLLNGKQLPQDSNSPTQENIRVARDTIDQFVDEMESDQKIFEFLQFCLKALTIIRLEVEDFSQAIGVFLKVNNRGLTLDSADLLKSLLFQSVKSDNEFEKLSNNWEIATTEVFKSRLKRTQSMEFLLKLLIGIKTGESVSSGRLFKKWQDELRDNEREAKLLGQDLVRRARNINKISHSKFPTDQDNPNGDSFDLFYGTHTFKVVQHFEVLLAADHFTPEAYRCLASLIESRVVLSLFSGEKNQSFERLVHKCSKNINALQANASYDEIREALNDFYVDIEQLCLQVFPYVSSLTYSTQSHHLRIRFFLATIAKHVQELVSSSTFPIQSYMQTTRKNGTDRGFDLDHLFPQSDIQLISWPKEDFEQNGHERVRKAINGVGNLILLHPSDNRTQQDSLPWDVEKLQNISDSELWINKLLPGMPIRLPNAAKSKKLEGWMNESSFSSESWSVEHTEKRLHLYSEIFIDSLLTALNP